MGMIYVLTQGEYSDYCIVCCTTNHDYAKAYAKLHDCDIEEFEDENDKSIIQEANEMLPYFSIRINPKGNPENGQTMLYVTKDDVNRLQLKGAIITDNSYVIDVLGDDYDKALKIALDARAKSFAEYLNL